MVPLEGPLDQVNPIAGLKATVSLCLGCLLNDVEHM